MFSSTWATATIGGFIVGGSVGVGSCTWGGLRDPGNIIRLGVITPEATPRVIDEALRRVSHAYGSNGVITELKLPSAPAYDWVGIFVTLPDFARAVDFAADFGNHDGILKKLVSVCKAPVAQDYFQRVALRVRPGDALLGIMVAPHAMDAFLTFAARWPDARVIWRSDRTHWPRARGCGLHGLHPHRHTLEVGGRQFVDAAQLQFKREAEPKDRLNPGKMTARDDPDWRSDRMYAAPPRSRAAE